ncbi:MAG: HAMP domain-containing sensor histidine kinase [Rhodospirillales bacterium]
MGAFLEWLTRAEGFTPHGYCLIWDPGLIYLHVASDLVIAASYLSIPAVLMIIARRRPDLNPYNCMYLFSAFIVACGITHLFGMVTLWHPVYAASGMVKLATAGISLTVAMMLWPLLPKVLATPSGKDLADSNEKLRKLTSQLEDIVEERTRALRGAYEKVEAAHRQSEEVNALKTQFLATMSHELRTPLNAIVGFSDMLRLGYAGDLNERQKEYFNHIHTSASLLDSLVSDVLVMQRLEISDEKVAAIDLLEVARETVAMVMLQADAANLDIEIDCPHPVVAETQRRPLKLLLTNLLTNAVKYGAGGGKIGIRLRRQPKEGFFAIEVWDRGRGIPAEKIESIFLPFVRLNESVSGPAGTGIGLTLVRQIVTSLGGSIDVESEVGKGTSFHIRLPDEPKDFRIDSNVA